MHAQSDFAEQFVRGQDRVYAFIGTLLPNRTDAEEVFQQTSLVLWRKWEQFEAGTDFVKWACTIARYEVLNYIRRGDRSPQAFSSDVIELLADERRKIDTQLDDRRVALRHCIDTLPPRQRELVEQAYSGVEAINEIATRLGQTSNALYLSLRRIRHALAECIRQRVAEGAGE
ncbi:MAG: sigma-70 family RNA polymerase sigma factor [Planctomycetes bacterium]|nr:sigma-70 family RNA polymerase sigma factor [Planctomycetota bacterium]